MLCWVGYTGKTKTAMQSHWYVELKEVIFTEASSKIVVDRSLEDEKNGRCLSERIKLYIAE